MELEKQLEEAVAGEAAAREAAEAANADLEATRQHAFELKVCSCMLLVRDLPCNLSTQPRLTSRAV